MNNSDKRQLCQILPPNELLAKRKKEEGNSIEK